MAQQMADYLYTIPDDVFKTRRTEIETKANEIANLALEQEPTLFVATGIATAFVPFAVVQFPGYVKRAFSKSSAALETKQFFASYWRIMGNAWNRTGNSEQWGFPFRDCGPLQQRWLWPYTATVQVDRFKLVAALFVLADSDPCLLLTSSELAMEIYGRQRHSCNAETEVCVAVTAGENLLAARNDLFTCDCRPGFVRSNTTVTTDSLSSVPCISCHLVSDLTIKYGTLCNASSFATPSNNVAGVGHNANLELLLSEVEEVAALSLESLMNATIGAVIGTCIAAATGLAMCVYRKRKFKTIAMSMWTILETIIVGIVIMYCAVLLHFLEASTLRCLLEPWLRELGFVICYGAIILKLYRHLIEFRTRKAHRCVVRDVDLLKYLCAMIVAVLCYLSAFTASSMDFVEHSAQVDGLRAANNLCRPLKWDYVTEAGEMAILLFGLYLSYISRNAKTMFQVRRIMKLYL